MIYFHRNNLLISADQINQESIDSYGENFFVMTYFICFNYYFKIDQTFDSNLRSSLSKDDLFYEYNDISNKKHKYDLNKKRNSVNSNFLIIFIEINFKNLFFN